MPGKAPISISALVITHNEERNIKRCLESLKAVADEIIVVDSFSTDQTTFIAEKLGARVVQHAFEGHIQQKNWAITQAQHPYVLSLDADEALSPALQESIRKVKTSPEADGYTFNRLNNYCGQWIRHAGWYPDTKLRLWNKNKGQWGGINPHDRLMLVPGSTQMHLKGDLLHYTYYTVVEHRERAWKYAQLGAQHLFDTGRKATWVKLYLSPLVRFLKMYFFQLGFLEGTAGWLIASITTREVFWKYRLLREMQNRKL